MSTRLGDLSEHGNDIEEGLFARPLHHQITPSATSSSAGQNLSASSTRLTNLLPTLDKLNVTRQPAAQTPRYDLPRIAKGMYPDDLKVALEERRRNAPTMHIAALHAPYMHKPPSTDGPNRYDDAAAGNNPTGDPRLLLDLLSPNSITFQNILDRLSTCEIVSLSKVCKSLRNIQTTYWPIRSHLLRYVDEPLQFRKIMMSTGAIVAGTAALSYSTKGAVHANDLNLFVEKEEDVLKWIHYLETEEWYVFTPADWQPDDIEDAVKFTYGGGAKLESKKDSNGAILADDQEEKMAGDKEYRERWMALTAMTEVLRDTQHMLGFHLFTHPTTKRRINIIATNSAPLYCLLRDVNNTAGMTFYTATKFYCLFPYFTVNQRCQYQLGHSKPRHYGSPSNSSIEKYMKLGWHVANTESEAKGLRAKLFPIRHHRRIGDRYTWIIPFDNEGINTVDPQISDEIIEMSTFNIYCVSSRTRSPNAYSITCRIFNSPSLKHIYILDGTNFNDPQDWKSRSKVLEPGSWGKFLKWKLDGYVDVERFISPMGSDGQGGCGFQYDAQMEMLYGVWKAGQGGVDGDEIPEWVRIGRG